MELLGGLRYWRVTLRIFWLWLGVNGFLTLDVSTEAVAHGREQLALEIRLAGRSESRIKRCGNHAYVPSA